MCSNMCGHNLFYILVVLGEPMTVKELISLLYKMPEDYRVEAEDTYYFTYPVTGVVTNTERKCVVLDGVFNES
jgi:hypothetical protein